MKIKFLKDEDFLQYKKPCMFIGAPTCTWKCAKEAGLPCTICQNYPWSKEPVQEIENSVIIKRYLSNRITKGVVFGGLEPMDNFVDLVQFIYDFRIVADCPDVIVIYTGYNQEEKLDEVEFLRKKYTNIIFKFGRYKPNYKPHYDKVLGIDLASPNQYGKIIC